LLGVVLLDLSWFLEVQRVLLASNHWFEAHGPNARERSRLLSAIGEGVPQIVRLLRVPHLLVEDVGAHINMPAIVGVELVMRRLVGGVRGLIAPWLALWLVLRLYLPRRGGVLEVGNRCCGGGSSDGAVASGCRPAA
jgi:hypothetical protein